MNIDYTFKIDGLSNSVNYYRSKTPMDQSEMPLPTKTGIVEKSYSDVDVENNGIYYVRFGSVKGDFEKISNEIIVYIDKIIEIFSRKRGYYFNPNILSTMWQDADRTIQAEIGSPVMVIDNLCKIPNTPSFAKSISNEKRPILMSDELGNYLDFTGSNCMVVENVLNIGDRITNFSSLEIKALEDQIILETSENYNTSNKTLISCIQKVSNDYSLTVAANNGSYSSDLNFALGNVRKINFIAFQEIKDSSSNFMKVNNTVISKNQNYAGSNFINGNHFIGSRNNSSLFLKAKLRNIGVFFDKLTDSEMEVIEAQQSKYL